MLYTRLHEVGMAFKTITDHHRIDGCLALAHHPDVFISEEVTTYFPDGVKIHLLVWNLTEAQHEVIQKVRENIYDFSAYLRKEELPHAVTHPLTALNRPITMDHFEKLVLLFKVFEGINGNREPLAQEVTVASLRALTREKIEELANRHGIEPTHANPEIKILTAGSDDHGGLDVGNCWTGVPAAKTPKEYFAALHQGSGTMEGPRGDPLRLSSVQYRIVLAYAQDRLRKKAPLAANLLKTMAERFLAGQNPTRFSFGEKIGHLTEAIRSGQAFEFLKIGEPSLTRQIGDFVTDSKVVEALDRIISEEKSSERRTFRMASYLTNQLGYRLTRQFIRRMEQGDVLDALQTFTGVLPAAGVLLPYLISFHRYNADRTVLRQTARSFCGSLPLNLRNSKRAWFTDTLEDVNGVARTICAMARAAQNAGKHLTVVTSRSDLKIEGLPIKNFTPVGEFEIPEYKLQKLSFPPVLEMVDYIQREGFTELIISTPGPIGLTALAAGRLLGLRISGIYHTDFPQYARILTDDSFMESLMWSYMQWFYGQFDLIYSNSAFYQRYWRERGIPEERLEILPRGLDTELFNPKHHDSKYWKSKGAKGPVILYVGRISKEKELGFLAEVALALKKRGTSFTLAMVGDGPYREELSGIFPEVIFTGILTGRELGIAYASADVFIFPSTTDTFGNVVIEALAAGLPVLVSDVGGPRELVTRPEQGRVIPARDLAAWVKACEELLQKLPDRSARLQMAQWVHDERSWDRAFETFWKQGEVE